MDGWFPRFSPTGRHLLRGAVTLSVDGVAIVGDGISGAWLTEAQILYRQHSTGQLRRWAAGLDEAVGPVCHQVVAALGRWAIWAQTDDAARTPYVWASDARHWEGFGGGFAPLAIAPDGTLVMGHATTGVLHVVAPDTSTPVPLAPGITPRCGATGVVWAHEGRLAHAPLRPGGPVTDVTVPGESCHGPVLVDTPEGPWLLTHTSSGRLLLAPLGATQGYVVAEGETLYPDAAWTPAGVRVAWSDGQGQPGEACVALTAPRVDLAARPVWHPVGTVVDTLPFLVPDYAGTLRCPADGQTLQTVRTGPREVCCLKGAPDQQERWRWDDQAVYLTYDATDGREGRPWRVSPEPIWCRRVSFVGDSQAYRDTVLVRRTLAGGSTREAFPVRTSVYAYGEHIPVAGIGRCRILTTTWEPHAPESQYQERHWWAIREVDGLRLGRVRYEEWRRGVLARSFDFTQLLPDVQLVPAPLLAIPDPVEPPERPDTPETPDMPEILFPPRDETRAFLEHLEARYRDDLQRPPRETHVDAEGTAVWLESYLRYRVQGRAHAAAVAAVMTDIDRVLGIGPPPPANGLVGALRVV